MKWSVAHEYRDDNPAEQVLARLPTVKSHQEHYASLPYRRVGPALVALESLSVPQVVKLVVPFLVLTAVRLREATEASWSEFDLEDGVWTIPARRMKKRKRHRVPLSRQVLEILGAARKLDSSGVLVFGYRLGRRPPRPLRSREVSRALRQLELKDVEDRDVVTHGFRSTFTDWVADHAKDSGEASEAALAHQPADATRRAYLRTDMLDARRSLMQQWADYVLPPQ